MWWLWLWLGLAGRTAEDKRALHSLAFASQPRISFPFLFVSLNPQQLCEEKQRQNIRASASFPSRTPSRLFCKDCILISIKSKFPANPNCKNLLILVNSFINIFPHSFTQSCCWLAMHSGSNSPSYSSYPEFSMNSSSSNHSSSMVRQRVCSVCSGPSNGFYFGVLSCRACASFYRRSALERRQYLCRRANNCAIQADGMRNSCRACRLHRCMQAGMCIESTAAESAKLGSSTPENVVMPPVKFERATAAFYEAESSTDPNKLCLNMAFDTTTPSVQQFVQSIKNLHNGHKALVNVICERGYLNLGDPNEVHLITLAEHLKTQRGEVTLILALIREHFHQLDELTNETKVMILKCFAFILNFMSRAEMTIQAFPTSSTDADNKIVIHPGHYMDRTNLDYFFSTVDKGPMSCTEHQRHSVGLITKILKKIREKYQPLEINPSEFAALIGIQMWNCVERHVPMLETTKTKRNQLFAELHTLLAQRLGPEPGAIGIRYGQLLGLVQEISSFAWEMDETLTVLKLFNPLPLRDLWEDLLSGRQKLDIVEETADMERTVIALSRLDEDARQKPASI